MPKHYAMIEPWEIGLSVDYGVVASATSTTLTARGKAWTVGKWAGCVVKIVGGTGTGQSRRVRSNTATVITVDAAWTTNPDATSAYVIIADPNGEGAVILPLLSAVSGASAEGDAYYLSRGVRSFLAFLNVTAVPTGGASRLNVYIQTLLPDGATWTDVASFAQVSAISSEVAAYTGPAGAGSGTQTEGGTVTADNYFAVADATLTASTVRLIPLGAALRAKYVVALNGDTGTFTFTVDVACHD